MRLAKPGETKPRVIRMRKLSSSVTRNNAIHYEKDNETFIIVVHFVGYLNIMGGAGSD